MFNQFLFYSRHVHNVQQIYILQQTCPQCSTSVYSTADMSTMFNQFLFYSRHVHNVQPVFILRQICPQCSTSVYSIADTSTMFNQFLFYSSTSDSVYSTADMSLALYITEIRLLLDLSFWHCKTSNNIYVMSGNLSPMTIQSNTRQLIILTKSDKAFICIYDILSIDMIVFAYV
jgi:ribosomal protein S27AE